MRSKRSFNQCNDLDLNEIKSNQWQDKETDSLTLSEMGSNPAHSARLVPGAVLLVTSQSVLSGLPCLLSVPGWPGVSTP